MASRHVGLICLFAFLAAGLTTSGAAVSVFKTTLLGKNCVPPGDPKASGTATIYFIIGRGAYNVSWDLILRNAASPSQFMFNFIRSGAPGVAGKGVVSLHQPPFWKHVGPGNVWRSTGNINVQVISPILNTILKNPAGYHVAVISPAYSSCAVRGQL